MAFGRSMNGSYSEEMSVLLSVNTRPAQSVPLTRLYDDLLVSANAYEGKSADRCVRVCTG